MPLLVASGAGGVGTLLLLKRGRYSLARVTAAIAVVAVIWGWAAGQYPYLIVGRLTLEQAQGAHATLQALLGIIIAGLAVIGPALTWLLLLTRRGDLTQGSSRLQSGERSEHSDPARSHPASGAASVSECDQRNL